MQLDNVGGEGVDQIRTRNGSDSVKQEYQIAWTGYENRAMVMIEIK